MNKLPKVSIEFIGIVLIIILFVMFTSFCTDGFLGGKYRAFKCNYIAALFGPDANANRKEFGGDPCMKKGNNRFKNYYSKKFKSLSDCKHWIDTEDMSYLRAPKNKYVLGCDKK
mgnify:FL=1|tara:strand:+ start:17 stop:358 length:342 start_codon:yes stop_codon:yes gene_type:complete